MISIAIVEDNRAAAVALEKQIDCFGNCKVVTKQPNGFAFLQYCNTQKTRIDIAIVDVNMPVMDGVSLTEHLTCYVPDILVIALSTYTDREIVENMLACGAKGYVSKAAIVYANSDLSDSKLSLLQEAIRAVIAHEYYIDPYTLNQVDFKNAPPLDIPALVQKRQEERTIAKQLGLTNSEIKSACLYATTTASQQAIADSLAVANKTTEKHLYAAKQKLQVSSRQELSLKAIAYKIVRIATGFRL